MIIVLILMRTKTIQNNVIYVTNVVFLFHFLILMYVYQKVVLYHMFFKKKYIIWNLGFKLDKEEEDVKKKR